MINWKNEGQKLPKVGQRVLLAVPRQSGETWDISVARLLVRYEGVVPVPVSAGSAWPTDYYWNNGKHDRDICMVTGNGWWASLADIPLPPGAVHGSDNGFDYILQIGTAFVPRSDA